MLKKVETLPPSSETAVIVYPPGLSILRLGNVAMPDASVTAVLPVMGELPLLVETMRGIVALFSALPPADPLRTVTTGVNCGVFLRLVVPPLTAPPPVGGWGTGAVFRRPPPRTPP